MLWQDVEPEEATLKGIEAGGRWSGKAAHLSPSHVCWPAIEKVKQATKKASTGGHSGYPIANATAAFPFAEEYLDALKCLEDRPPAQVSARF